MDKKLVVITGAGTGLGKRYALHLSSEKFSVVVLDLKNPSPQDFAKAEILFIETDVSDENQVRKSFDRILSEFGRIDILINNASTYGASVTQSFEEITAEQWRRTFDINVLGAFLCTKASVGHFKKKGRGKVINIASDAPLKGLPKMLDYVCSKGTLISMTRALARELGVFGITVNDVAPGYVKHEEAPNWNEERDVVVRGNRCLNRTQGPDDLIGVIEFLCSDSSDFITGQTIVVDGGEVFV